MKAAIIYWSKTGNTAKVARAIQEGLEAADLSVSFHSVDEAQEIDFYAYDLLCVGFPSYQWHPPKPVDSWLKGRLGAYHKKGYVKVGAPKAPGKYVLIFCTYSGPHTGLNEAVPAGKYAGQFFEHLGFTVLDEWYVLGEYHGSLEHSTQGRMGDIRGLPTPADLAKIRQDATRLITRIPVFESAQENE